MATQFADANKHDSTADTRPVNLTIQVTTATAFRLDALAQSLGYATTDAFLAEAVRSLAEKLSAGQSGEAPYWAQPGKQYTYEVEFIVTYEGQIQADNDAEMRDILGRVSIEDTADDREWHVDPWRFQKRLVHRDTNAEEEEEEGWR